MVEDKTIKNVMLILQIFIDLFFINFINTIHFITKMKIIRLINEKKFQEKLYGTNFLLCKHNIVLIGR